MLNFLRQKAADAYIYAFSPRGGIFYKFVTIDILYILCHRYNLSNHINMIITPTSVILVLHEGDVATLTETLLLEPVPAAFVASQV